MNPFLLPKAGVAAIIAPGTVPNVNPAAEKHATKGIFLGELFIY